MSRKEELLWLFATTKKLGMSAGVKFDGKQFEQYHHRIEGGDGRIWAETARTAYDKETTVVEMYFTQRKAWKIAIFFQNDSVIENFSEKQKVQTGGNDR